LTQANKTNETNLTTSDTSVVNTLSVVFMSKRSKVFIDTISLH
jgi:hypothetical protein